MDGFFPILVTFILNLLLMGFGGFKYLSYGIVGHKDAARGYLVGSIALGLIGTGWLLGWTGFLVSLMAAIVVLFFLAPAIFK